ncbi:MAG: biopolymer transporter ExbD [Pseudomonadota bacterium]
MIASRRRRVEREPTIALINIVFLILIFFMVAGTLSQTPKAAFEFVTSRDLECCAPGDTLTISSGGDLAYNGADYGDVGALIAANPELREVTRVIPARDLPATRLMETLNRLRAGGVERLVLVTERTS